MIARIAGDAARVIRTGRRAIGRVTYDVTASAIARIRGDVLLATSSGATIAVGIPVGAGPHRAGSARTNRSCIGIGTDIRAASTMGHIRARVLLTAVVCVAITTHESGVTRRRTSSGATGRGAVRVGTGNTARKAVARRIERRFATIGRAAAAIAPVRIAATHLTGA